MPYQLFANVVLVVHFGLVLFVVGGLLLVILGNQLQWAWVNHWCFRVLHLAAILVVVAESWLGITCPLTSLEWWLREQAGARPDAAGFVQHWLHALLFYDAPLWVFTTAYTLFALLVIWVWWRYPPRSSS